MHNKTACIKSIVRFLLLVLAAGFLACGFLRGEWETVLYKAVNVCFECIGLG